MRLKIFFCDFRRLFKRLSTFNEVLWTRQVLLVLRIVPNFDHSHGQKRVFFLIFPKGDNDQLLFLGLLALGHPVGHHQFNKKPNKMCVLSLQLVDSSLSQVSNVLSCCCAYLLNYKLNFLMPFRFSVSD